MTPKHTSRADSTPLRVVMLTMDTHLASGATRVQKSLARELPGLTLTLHAASEWCASARALESVLADIAAADFIVATMLFMEDHYLPIVGALRARRGRCDALLCAMSAGEVVSLTQVGGFDMSSKDAGLLSMLRRLRGQRGKKPEANSGAQQMRMLRRLPKLLRFIPGTAQDVRAYFLCLQYWLGGSADNLANLVRCWSIATRMVRGARCGVSCAPSRRSTIPRSVFTTRDYRSACAANWSSYRMRPAPRAAPWAYWYCAPTCWPRTRPTTTA
jgi:magnesium chelatase subunit H